MLFTSISLGLDNICLYFLFCMKYNLFSGLGNQNEINLLQLIQGQTEYELLYRNFLVYLTD